jgi:hypothetical protein
VDRRSWQPAEAGTRPLKAVGEREVTDPEPS